MYDHVYKVETYRADNSSVEVPERDRRGHFYKSDIISISSEVVLIEGGMVLGVE